MWDVSGTKWEEYDHGKGLRTPTFSCAGVHGLYLKFYPKGRTNEREPRVCQLHDSR